MAIQRRALSALVLLLTASGLTSCGGGGGHRLTKVAATVAPPGDRLVSYTNCQDLLSDLRTATEKQVGPYGLMGGPVTAVPFAGEALLAASGPSRTQYSGTNVNEPGVDEPDMVKTDGHRLVVLAHGALQVIDPVSRKVAYSLALPNQGMGYGYGPGGGNLLLSGDHALVITPEFSRFPLSTQAFMPIRPGQRTRLTIIDLTAAPQVTGTLTVDGAYIDARQVGSSVRIVVRSTPRIGFPPPRPPYPIDEKKAIDANRRIVAQAPIGDWLPGYEVDTEKVHRTGQVPCDRVGHPVGAAGTSLTSVLTLDLAQGIGDPAPVSLAADGTTVYGTGSSLYLASTQGWNKPGNGGLTTDLHKFDISGPGRPRYVASGSVPGTLLNQYSLSEYAGNLRVATQSGSPWRGGPNAVSSVYVLAPHGPRLETIGSVGGLGKGERLYAVRFIGPAGYAVTYRQTDPLFTLDLHDPAKPAVTGELKISGYSAYLHPTADGRLLGIGQDTGSSWGTQVSLFDVTGTPKRLGLVRIPGTQSQAEYDPHAFLYWPRSGLTVVPLMGGNRPGGEVLVLSVTAGGIRKVGTVTQPGGQYWSPIQRSLIIGDTLWTISDTGAQATAATTLTKQSWIPF